MADEKKKPAGSDINDLKARLGLKKGDAAPPPVAPAGATPAAPTPGATPAAVPNAPVPAAARPAAAPPGILGQPPAAAPMPAFMQQAAARPKVDVTRDPFAPQLGGEVRRPSLIGESRPSMETVSAEDQKAAQKRNLIITLAISVLTLGAGFTIGALMGQGCSQRRLREIAVADGADIYTMVQNGTKKLADVKKAVTAASGKAAKLEYDASSVAKLRELTKRENPPPILLADIAGRNYQIYTGDTVPIMFTYTSQWVELQDKIKEHVIRSENDVDAIKGWKGKAEKLATTNYGIIFNPFPFGEDTEALVGNLVLVTTPFDPATVTYQVQFDEGMPVSEELKPEVYKVGAGDPTTELQKWIVPLGDMTKFRLEEKAKKRFDSYIERLKGLGELITAMEKNQQSLVQTLGTIAAEI